MLNTILDIKRMPAESIVEPVDLAEAKAWLIIDPDNTEDDALLTRLIKQVRSAIETKTKLSLVEKTITITVDLHREFKLPYGPVRSISSVSYRTGTNTDGTPDNQTLATTDYTTDGEDFKVIRSSKCGIHTIVYVAGCGTSEDPEYSNPAPEDLKTAILTQVAFMYENRGDKKDPGNFCVIALNLIRPLIDVAHI